MTAILRIGLVGAGSMGSNHARVLANSTRAKLVTVVDPMSERAAAVAEHFGGAVATGLDALKGCDGVIVATPTDSHVGVATQLLDADFPLLVEKPISEVYGEVEAVVSESRKRSVPLMCGFVERFNAAVIALERLLEEKSVHIVGIRHSPRNSRAVSSVTHDLLIHDVDLVLRLCADRIVEKVTGATWRPPNTSCSEIADCTIYFRDGPIATLSASRMSQRKVRTLHVDTGTSLYEADLLREDLTVYQHVSHSMGEASGVTYRAQTTVEIPFMRHDGEPLALEVDRFLDLIESGGTGVDIERDSILPPHRLVADFDRV